MATIAEIRREPERLGRDTQPADVEAFIEAVRRYQVAHHCEEHEAIEYVWNDGDCIPRMIEWLGPHHEWVRDISRPA